MCPSVGTSSRFNERRNVDFPEPEGPTITTTSPFLISSEVEESEDEVEESDEEDKVDEEEMMSAEEFFADSEEDEVEESEEDEVDEEEEGEQLEESLIAEYRKRNARLFQD